MAPVPDFGEPDAHRVGVGAMPNLPSSNLPAPARLRVGVISAGRVGTSLGLALEGAGHIVTDVAAASSDSRRRAAEAFPLARIAAPEAVAAAAELLVLAVPDPVLPELVRRLLPVANRSAIVLHTSGALGAEILAPLHERGATVVAFHPAMTFTDPSVDAARIAACAIGITALDEIGYAVGQALALELGAEPVRIGEAARPLYHAALAHGANHLVALVDDAVAALRAALDTTTDTVGGPAQGMAQRVLAPLARAALDNALRSGAAALTGPSARGDAAAVGRHLAALDEMDPAITDAYRAQSRRAAHQSGTSAKIEPVLQENR